MHIQFKAASVRSAVGMHRRCGGSALALRDAMPPRWAVECEKALAADPACTSKLRNAAAGRDGVRTGTGYGAREPARRGMRRRTGRGGRRMPATRRAQGDRRAA